jgi:hypothetical protein
MPDTPRSKLSQWSLRIPVEFLPSYEVEVDDDGKRRLVDQVGAAELCVPAEQVALVLMDTWGRPDEPPEPGPVRAPQQRVLAACRQHGVTIIYSPSRPVATKYSQYLRLQKEVKSYLKPFDLNPKNSPPFMRWPLRNNQLELAAKQIRADGRAAHHELLPRSELDISRHLKPLPDEYIVCTHPEFRYVLWKEGIQLLLYLGGALNECMLHRETGINMLAGTDNHGLPFTIVVLGDCSTASVSPEISKEEATKAMLDYYKRKIAFVADSTALEFSRVENEGHGISQPRIADPLVT